MGGILGDFRGTKNTRSTGSIGCSLADGGQFNKAIYKGHLVKEFIVY